jgi:hypothetical protein
MSAQQLMPESPADPEAHNLADDCRDDAGHEQRPDIEAMAGGEKRRRNQRGLGR